MNSPHRTFTFPINWNKGIMKARDFNQIVKEQILQTGLYKGRHITEAEDDSELYYYLSEIKKEYVRDLYSLVNADSKMAVNFLKNMDQYFEADIEDFYGSNEENTKAINLYLKG